MHARLQVAADEAEPGGADTHCDRDPALGVARVALEDLDRSVKDLIVGVHAVAALLDVHIRDPIERRHRCEGARTVGADGLNEPLSLEEDVPACTQGDGRR
jgi:hypothetical protein